uniref:hypothetical protein n=1 Tax=Pedobacter schmidteae TaxID=2201271 RepID=UPI000EAFE6D4|nr:hypothetical protein [Pedobacter schmidteae]
MKKPLVIENNDKKKTIGDFLAADFRMVSVLLDLEIDIVTSKNETLGQVCKRMGISPAKFDQTLVEFSLSNEPHITNYNSWPINLVADYIHMHRICVAEKLSVLALFLNKLCKSYGEIQPQLCEIKYIILQSFDRFSEGLKPEYDFLLRFIKTSLLTGHDKEPITSPNFNKVRKTMVMMTEENEIRQSLLKKMMLLAKECSSFAPVDETFLLAMDLLKDVEKAMKKHCSLENGVLFPKVQEVLKVPEDDFALEPY